MQSYKYKQMFRNAVDKYMLVYYYGDTNVHEQVQNGGEYALYLHKAPNTPSGAKGRGFGINRQTETSSLGLVPGLWWRDLRPGEDTMRKM